MFNEQELKYLEENNAKDLISIRAKMTEIHNQMARLGKALYDLKQSEIVLASINEAIADNKKIEDSEE